MKKRAPRKRKPKRRKTISLDDAIRLVNERFSAGGLRLEERRIDGKLSVCIKLGYRELELAMDDKGRIEVVVDCATRMLLGYEEAAAKAATWGGRLPWEAELMVRARP